MVVSVPNKNTCLSGIETKLKRETVGAEEITAALVPVPVDVSHLKVFPILTVANKSSPKLSNDQLRPSIVTLDVERAVPHASLPVSYTHLTLPTILRV